MLRDDSLQIAMEYLDANKGRKLSKTAKEYLDAVKEKYRTGRRQQCASCMLFAVKMAAQKAAWAEATDEERYIMTFMKKERWELRKKIAQNYQGTRRADILGILPLCTCTRDRLGKLKQTCKRDRLGKIKQNNQGKEPGRALPKNNVWRVI